jgi:hypothetical protein
MGELLKLLASLVVLELRQRQARLRAAEAAAKTYAETPAPVRACPKCREVYYSPAPAAYCTKCGARLP